MEHEKLIKETIEKILNYAKIEHTIDIKKSSSQNGGILASINTRENAKLLIGKNGENLRSLEHLVRIISSKNIPEGDTLGPVSLDVNDYRKIRASYVVELAKDVVSRVRNTQKPEALSPMTAYERKVVHTELAAYPDINTESIGEGPNRRIIIKPYP